MKQFLVTGGAGFISSAGYGQYLLDLRHARPRQY